MTVRIRDLAGPAFLLLALVFGGSTRGIWPNMALQLGGIALLAWTGLSVHRGIASGPARGLVLVALAGLVLILLQLIPLPPGLWAALPGREPIASGYRLLGEDLPWLALSLVPYATLASSLALLAPIGLAALILTRPQRERWLAWALLAGACLGVLLGALQSASGGPGRSSLFFYEITNGGAVGFFANRNHMGTLLLAGLPFAFALFGGWRKGAGGNAGASSGLVAAALFLLLVGIALNGSTAVLALGVPVLALSILILPVPRIWRRLAGAGAFLALVAAVLLLLATPVSSSAQGLGDLSLQSRLQIWQTSVPAAKDVFPLGSGLGSFESLYHLYEDPAQTTRTYVNHVHNDYLELLIELGLPGVLLVIAFFVWWVQRLLFAWRSLSASRFARAAGIASGAILVQSLVDYPLRTSAIACVFALCLGLMARASQPGREGAGADRGVRHVVIR